jgi:hypothetical protein
MFAREHTIAGRKHGDARANTVTSTLFKIEHRQSELEVGS